MKTREESEKIAGFKTRSEIAEEFNISTKTLYRKIKEAGLKIPSKTLLSPREYRPIYDQFLDRLKP